MHFLVTADTDTGTVKKNNQDSIMFRHARCELGEIVMAIICDGMGGLEKGELASATVIREFERWYDEELPFELEHPDMQIIGNKWALLLKKLNGKISEYGNKLQMEMGTTFTGVLFVDSRYVVVHVGDTRFYQIGKKVRQLTTDHTYIAREVSRGNLTYEQAHRDKKRNMLLQCVGASQKVEPEIICGQTLPGVYMLCSDGFRHVISEEEIQQAFCPSELKKTGEMHKRSLSLMEQIKSRGERDNISVVVIKVS